MVFWIVSRNLFLVVLVASGLVLGSSIAVASSVVKSANDKRQYESFQLPNKLNVLVISDPDTDKAAASLDVLIGSRNDPSGREGLAHFLEHMLFLGTEKYPQPGEYQAFISGHGGSHNAFTSFEHTNYFFDVGKEHLEPALDRFAQFFIAPLFTPEYVTRERNAVHSEYRSKIKDHARRVMDAKKQVLNPRHPRSRFPTGSLQTLADGPGGSVRDQLLEFYTRYYSAHRMTLVVLGRESVQALKELVAEKFSSVRNSTFGVAAIGEPLFEAGSLPALLQTQPLNDRQSMSLTFPIPSLPAHYRTKPADYIANLLGHEGEGSLLSLLRSKGWVSALTATAGARDLSETTFTVSLGLTSAGLDHVQDIASHVFQYLRLVQASGLERWRFDEQAELYKMQFRFQEKSPAINYVRSLALRLHLYPPEEVLRAPYAMDSYRPALIREVLDHLRPEKVLLTVSAKTLETNAISPWYRTPLMVASIASDSVQRWRTDEQHPALFLPKRNEFIPANLMVEPSAIDANKPALIKSSERLSLWFHQDDSYNVPRANFFFSVRSEVSNSSVAHAVFTDLYVRLVNDQLKEFSYPARLAGLSYRLNSHLRGFSVHISGYSDKQSVLVARIASTLRNPSVESERFDSVKEDLTRALLNTNKVKPYKQMFNEVKSLLVRPSWTAEERLGAIESLTASDLERFIPQLLRGISIVALSHGNLNRERALHLAGVLEEKLLVQPDPVSPSEVRVIKLRSGERYARQLQIDHPDSAVTLYFQGPDKSYMSKANVALLRQVVSPAFYHDLRTERQLGYVVFSTMMSMFGAPGMGFIVQSPTTDPIALVDHVERFISDYRNSIVALSDDEFTKQKNSLLTRILDGESSLRERSRRYWRELTLDNYDFDSREQLAEAVRQITQEELIEFYEHFLIGQSRKRLVVHSVGSDHAEAFQRKEQATDDRLILNPHVFAQDNEYFSSSPALNPI